MKYARILFPTLIIIGVGLLFTQSMWVPKLVNKIIESEASQSQLNTKNYVYRVSDAFLEINVGLEPNIDAPMVAKISSGRKYKFLILEEKDDWLKIFLDKDTVGWVPSFAVFTYNE